jgi:hypothetical protein
MADFDSADGEHYAGLNVLKLDVGQAAGPFVISRIDRDAKIGKPEGKKGVQKTIDKYFGFLTDLNGNKIAGRAEMALPIAKAFVMRCKDALVGVGDIIALKRTADYVSGQPQPGKGYELKVFKRAKAIQA